MRINTNKDGQRFVALRSGDTAYPMGGGYWSVVTNERTVPWLTRKEVRAWTGVEA